MKKIIITAVVTLITSICFGQGIRPSVYTPIYNNSQVQQNQTKQEAQTQTVTAYYIENDRFVRTSIKVRELSTLTAYTSMEVVEYLVRSDYGSYWQSVSAAYVQNVTSVDASVIRDNFYYKVYIPMMGTWFYF